MAIPASSPEADLRPRPGREAGWAVLLLLLGLVPRLVFVTLFPTQPVSDFAGVIEYALAFRDQSLTPPGYYWDVFNVGPALALSLLLRIFPDSPETTARLATAVWTGLMPLLPFAFWRGVLPLWVRVLAGGALALWPGQIFFSGVVAQDNWVTPPTVALAALAVRSLLGGGRGHPVAGGLLYALAVAMRQEMLYALFPLVLAAAGFATRRGRSWRNLGLCALAVGLPFLAMALQRQEATGRFGLSSGHAGYTLLGTVAPGATASYWSDPVSYVAAARPELVKDRQRLFSETMPLALDELRRRPGFHTLRTLSAALKFPFDSDAENLYWSVQAAGTLPAPRQAAGAAFAARMSPLLKLEMAGLQALFLASVALGLWRRNPAILAVALAALLKITLHAAIVAQGRFFTPATALEILTVALGAWEASRFPSLRKPALVLALALPLAAGLALSGRWLVSWVRQNDPVDDRQRTYRFTLAHWFHRGTLDCIVRQGRLTALGYDAAVLAPFHLNPAPGEVAAASCTLTGTGEPASLVLQISDPYEPGGQPGQVVQRVKIDGVEVFSHDLAAKPGGGWLDIPVGTVGPGTRKQVRIEIAAVQPAPGTAWGAIAETRFQLVPSTEETKQ
jgi:hypothetical protein